MEVYGSIVPKELCVFFFCSGASNPKLIFGSTLCDGDSYGYEGQNSTMRVEYCCAEIQGDRVVTLGDSIDQLFLILPTTPNVGHNALCPSTFTSLLPWTSMKVPFHLFVMSFSCVSFPWVFSHPHGTDLDIAKNVPSLFASLGCGSLSRLPLQASF